MNEQITEKGIAAAIKVLEDSGFRGYLSKSISNPTENSIRLIAVCEKYIEVSVAKGDARTEQEIHDGILVHLLQTHLQEAVSTMN